LTVQDIQEAADIFMPVYEATEGLDGYVSLEINPKLAYDTDATIEEGKRLHQKVKRPNLMLKVPSTKQGFMAIEELVVAGCNVNVTLIFSVEQYANSAHAYIRGIRRLLNARGNVRRLRSVASVFVSRVDTVVDKRLSELLSGESDEQTKERLNSLQGKAAVANAQLIYKKYLDIVSSVEFKEVLARGVNIQRVLWGSTSTKNPAYSDIKYVSELIAKDTVNTVPQDTLEAFLDHGKLIGGLASDVREAQGIIDELKKIGIDVNQVCAQLLKEGVVAFEKSFSSLLEHIEEKKKKLSKV
jgi:transaldolase